MRLDPIRLGNDVAKIGVVAAVWQLTILFRKASETGVDAAAFWSAGKLALAGRAAEAYQLEAIRGVQQAAGLELALPYLNPPPFLFLCLPLGLTSFPIALALWNIVTLIPYLWLSRRLFPQGWWMLAMFAPVLLNLIIGQNGLVTGALFIGAIMALEKRPILAGALVGALVIKPQLAILFPIAFIAGRQWRAFAAAAVTSLGLLAVSELAFPGTTQAFLANTAFTSSLLDRPELIRKLHSVHGALRMVGVPVQAALAIQAAVSLVMGLIVWRIWRGDRPMLVKGAALALAAPLATPYVWDYDLVFLALPLAVMARPQMLTAFGVYLAPTFTRIISLATGIGLAPAVIAFALWRLIRGAPAQPSVQAQSESI